MVTVVVWHRQKTHYFFQVVLHMSHKTKKRKRRGSEAILLFISHTVYFRPQELFQRCMDTASAEDSLINAFNHADLQH